MRHCREIFALVFCIFHVIHAAGSLWASAKSLPSAHHRKWTNIMKVSHEPARWGDEDEEAAPVPENAKKGAAKVKDVEPDQDTWGVSWFGTRGETFQDFRIRREELRQMKRRIRMEEQEREDQGEAPKEEVQSPENKSTREKTEDDSSKKTSGTISAKYQEVPGPPQERLQPVAAGGDVPEETSFWNRQWFSSSYPPSPTRHRADPPMQKADAGTHPRRDEPYPRKDDEYFWRGEESYPKLDEPYRRRDVPYRRREETYPRTSEPDWRMHEPNYRRDERYPERDGRYPERDGRYPERDGRYPERDERYPERDGRYPERDERYPERDERYPERYEPYPERDEIVKSREEVYPKDDEASPRRDGYYPKREVPYSKKDESYPKRDESYRKKDESYPQRDESYPPKDGTFPKKDGTCSKRGEEHPQFKKESTGEDNQESRRKLEEEEEKEEFRNREIKKETVVLDDYSLDEQLRQALKRAFAFDKDPIPVPGAGEAGGIRVQKEEKPREEQGGAQDPIEEHEDRKLEHSLSDRYAPYHVLGAIVSVIWLFNILFIAWILFTREASMKNSDGVQALHPSKQALPDLQAQMQDQCGDCPGITTIKQFQAQAENSKKAKKAEPESGLPLKNTNFSKAQPTQNELISREPTTPTNSPELNISNSGFPVKEGAEKRDAETSMSSMTGSELTGRKHSQSSLFKNSRDKVPKSHFFLNSRLKNQTGYDTPSSRKFSVRHRNRSISPSHSARLQDQKISGMPSSRNVPKVDFKNFQFSSFTNQPLNATIIQPPPNLQRLPEKTLPNHPSSALQKKLKEQMTELHNKSPEIKELQAHKQPSLGRACVTLGLPDRSRSPFTGQGDVSLHAKTSNLNLFGRPKTSNVASNQPTTVLSAPGKQSPVGKETGFEKKSPDTSPPQKQINFFAKYRTPSPAVKPGDFPIPVVAQIDSENNSKTPNLLSQLPSPAIKKVDSLNRFKPTSPASNKEDLFCSFKMPSPVSKQELKTAGPVGKQMDSFLQPKSLSPTVTQKDSVHKFLNRSPVSKQMNSLTQIKPHSPVSRQMNPLSQIKPHSPVSRQMNSLTQIKPHSPVSRQMNPLSQIKPHSPVSRQMNSLTQIKPHSPVSRQMNSLTQIKPHSPVSRQMNPLTQIKPHSSMSRQMNSLTQIKPHYSVSRQMNSLTQIKPHSSVSRQMNSLTQIKPHSSVSRHDDLFVRPKPRSPFSQPVDSLTNLNKLKPVLAQGDPPTKAKSTASREIDFLTKFNIPNFLSKQISHVANLDVPSKGQGDLLTKATSGTKLFNQHKNNSPIISHVDFMNPFSNVAKSKGSSPVSRRVDHFVSSRNTSPLSTQANSFVRRSKPNNDCFHISSDAAKSKRTASLTQAQSFTSAKSRTPSSTASKLKMIPSFKTSPSAIRTPGSTPSKLQLPFKTIASKPPTPTASKLSLPFKSTSTSFRTPTSIPSKTQFNFKTNLGKYRTCSTQLHTKNITNNTIPRKRKPQDESPFPFKDKLSKRLLSSKSGSLKKEEFSLSLQRKDAVGARREKRFGAENRIMKSNRQISGFVPGVRTFRFDKDKVTFSKPEDVDIKKDNKERMRDHFFERLIKSKGPEAKDHSNKEVRDQSGKKVDSRGQSPETVKKRKQILAKIDKIDIIQEETEEDLKTHSNSSVDNTDSHRVQCAKFDRSSHTIGEPAMLFDVFDLNDVARVPEHVLEALTCPQKENCGHDHQRYRTVGHKVYVRKDKSLHVSSREVSEQSGELELSLETRRKRMRKNSLSGPKIRTQGSSSSELALTMVKKKRNGDKLYDRRSSPSRCSITESLDISNSSKKACSEHENIPIQGRRWDKESSQARNEKGQMVFEMKDSEKDTLENTKTSLTIQKTCDMIIDGSISSCLEPTCVEFHEQRSSTETNEEKVATKHLASPDESQSSKSQHADQETKILVNATSPDHLEQTVKHCVSSFASPRQRTETESANPEENKDNSLKYSSDSTNVPNVVSGIRKEHCLKGATGDCDQGIVCVMPKHSELGEMQFQMSEDKCSVHFGTPSTNPNSTQTTEGTTRVYTQENKQIQVAPSVCCNLKDKNVLTSNHDMSGSDITESLRAVTRRKLCQDNKYHRACTSGTYSYSGGERPASKQAFCFRRYATRKPQAEPSEAMSFDNVTNVAPPPIGYHVRKDFSGSESKLDVFSIKLKLKQMKDAAVLSPPMRKANRIQNFSLCEYTKEAVSSKPRREPSKITRMKKGKHSTGKKKHSKVMLLGKVNYMKVMNSNKKSSAEKHDKFFGTGASCTDKQKSRAKFEVSSPCRKKVVKDTHRITEPLKAYRYDRKTLNLRNDDCLNAVDCFPISKDSIVYYYEPVQDRLRGKRFRLTKGTKRGSTKHRHQPNTNNNTLNPSAVTLDMKPCASFLPRVRFVCKTLYRVKNWRRARGKSRARKRTAPRLSSDLCLLNVNRNAGGTSDSDLEGDKKTKSHSSDVSVNSGGDLFFSTKTDGSDCKECMSEEDVSSSLSMDSPVNEKPVSQKETTDKIPESEKESAGVEEAVPTSPIPVSNWEEQKKSIVKACNDAILMRTHHERDFSNLGLKKEAIGVTKEAPEGTDASKLGASKPTLKNKKRAKTEALFIKFESSVSKKITTTTTTVMKDGIKTNFPKYSLPVKPEHPGLQADPPHPLKSKKDAKPCFMVSATPLDKNKPIAAIGDVEDTPEIKEAKTETPRHTKIVRCTQNRHADSETKQNRRGKDSFPIIRRHASPGSARRFCHRESIKKESPNKVSLFPSSGAAQCAANDDLPAEKEFSISIKTVGPGPLQTICGNWSSSDTQLNFAVNSLGQCDLNVDDAAKEEAKQTEANNGEQAEGKDKTCRNARCKESKVQQLSSHSPVKELNSFPVSVTDEKESPLVLLQLSGDLKQLEEGLSPIFETPDVQFKEETVPNITTDEKMVSPCLKYNAVDNEESESLCPKQDMDVATSDIDSVSTVIYVSKAPDKVDEEPISKTIEDSETKGKASTDPERTKPKGKRKTRRHGSQQLKQKSPSSTSSLERFSNGKAKSMDRGSSLSRISESRSKSPEWRRDCRKKKSPRRKSPGRRSPGRKTSGKKSPPRRDGIRKRSEKQSPERKPCSHSTELLSRKKKLKMSTKKEAVRDTLSEGSLRNSHKSRNKEKKGKHKLLKVDERESRRETNSSKSSERSKRKKTKSMSPSIKSSSTGVQTESTPPTSVIENDGTIDPTPQVPSLEVEQEENSLNLPDPETSESSMYRAQGSSDKVCTQKRDPVQQASNSSTSMPTKDATDSAKGSPSLTGAVHKSCPRAQAGPSKSATRTKRDLQEAELGWDGSFNRLKKPVEDVRATLKKRTKRKYHILKAASVAHAAHVEQKEKKAKNILTEVKKKLAEQSVAEGKSVQFADDIEAFETVEDVTSHDLVVPPISECNSIRNEFMLTKVDRETVSQERKAEIKAYEEKYDVDRRSAIKQVEQKMEPERKPCVKQSEQKQQEFERKVAMKQPESKQHEGDIKSAELKRELESACLAAQKPVKRVIERKKKGLALRPPAINEKKTVAVLKSAHARYNRGQGQGPTLVRSLTNELSPNVDYNTKINEMFLVLPMNRLTKKRVSIVGSPVDIKEIIEGSPVDGPDPNAAMLPRAARSAPQVAVHRRVSSVLSPISKKVKFSRDKITPDRRFCRTPKIMDMRLRDSGSMRFLSSSETAASFDESLMLSGSRSVSPVSQWEMSDSQASSRQASPRSTDLDEVLSYKEMTTAQAGASSRTSPSRRMSSLESKYRNRKLRLKKSPPAWALPNYSEALQEPGQLPSCGDSMDFDLLNVSLSWVLRSFLRRLPIFSPSATEQSASGDNQQPGVASTVN